MYSFLIIVEIFVSILLTIVVLMQASKGGGLAGTLGGSSIGMTFGVRRTSDFLSKTTTYLATAFMVLALIVNIWFLPRGERAQQSVIQSVPPPASLPPSQQPIQQPTGTPGQ